MGKLNIIEYVVGGESSCRFLGDIPVGINNFVGSVPEKELLMDVAACLAYDIFCAEILKKACYLKAALEV